MYIFLNLLNFSENKNETKVKKTEEEYFLEYYSKLTISKNETDEASYSKIPRFYFKVSCIKPAAVVINDCILLNSLLYILISAYLCGLLSLFHI